MVKLQKPEFVYMGGTLRAWDDAVLVSWRDGLSAALRPTCLSRPCGLGQKSDAVIAKACGTDK